MTNTTTLTNWSRTTFAVITARPFPSLDRPTFSTTGHLNATCPAIDASPIITDACLGDFMDANEHFDGEVDYLTPWPCPKCVAVDSHPHAIEFEARRDLPTQGTGTPAPRVAAPADPQADADLAEAREYAKSYAGTFEFMADMRTRATKGSTLTPKMVAAILRCKAADARKATPAVPANGNAEDVRRSTLAPNAFPGICRCCRTDVAGGAGRREKVAGSWTVLHSSTTECDVAKATIPAAAPQAAKVALPEVASGHYAVDAEEGHTAFYKVDAITEGRWAGRTFLSVQASDVYHPVRGAAVATILAKIATDPKAAMLRYGVEIGRCGHCNRVLTDPDSIARGIGPVCAGRMGY